MIQLIARNNMIVHGKAFHDSSVGLAQKTGTYTGDSSVNRAIPHGLDAIPKVVIVTNLLNGLHILISNGYASALRGLVAGFDYNLVVTASDSTNFYVGNATSYEASANLNATVLRWTAIV